MKNYKKDEQSWTLHRKLSNTKSTGSEPMCYGKVSSSSSTNGTCRATHVIKCDALSHIR